MKNVRKCISVLLIALFAISMAGCSLFNTGVSGSIVNTLKGYGVKEVEKQTDLIRITAKLNSEGSGYLILKDEKATKAYQSYFNTRRKLPTVDANQFIVAVILEKGDKAVHAASVYSAEFYSEDDAKEVYEKFSPNFTTKKQTSDEGTEKDYSYTLMYTRSSNGATVRGLYLEGKSVTMIQGSFYKGESNAFIDKFCKKMAWKSPMTIYDE